MSDIFRDYSFGGWVRHVRIENRITLRDAAKRLNMDSGNYSKMENSELDPPRKQSKIIEICNAIEKPELAKLLTSIAFQHHLSKFKDKFYDIKESDD